MQRPDRGLRLRWEFAASCDFSKLYRFFMTIICQYSFGLSNTSSSGSNSSSCGSQLGRVLWICDDEEAGRFVARSVEALTAGVALLG